MNITVCLPVQKEKELDLSTKAAAGYAQAAAAYLQKLSCPNGQKIDVINAVCSAVK